MKKLLIAILLFFCFQVSGQDILYASSQLEADLAFLHASLKKNHPNLYLYSSKKEIDAYFENLNEHIPPSMTGLGFYQYLTPICAKIKDGHTTFFPASELIAYHNEQSLFFPFKIYWDGKKMYVALNYTEIDEIENGAEIIAINGLPAASIIESCLTRMMRDGDNLTYPVWVLNQWFNEYYSYFYGHPTKFTIRYRIGPDETGQVKKIQALPKATIFANRAKRYPNQAFSRSYDQKEGNGLVLKLNRELKCAVLTIKDFDNAILKKNYKQPFKKSIREYFLQMEAAGITDLVLDLRNNQGGDIENGRILLSRLMNAPFQLVEGYAKVGEPEENTATKRNKPCKGPEMGLFQPKAHVFKGKLYLLINGGSFSNSGIVSSALKHYGRGVLIGEETGGNGHLIAGNPKSITLPNTGINVEISTLQFQIREKDKSTGHGVIPDVVIIPSIQEMIRGRDEVLEYAMKLVLK